MPAETQANARVLAFALLTLSAAAFGEPSIIPQPSQLRMLDGAFVLTPDTRIVADKAAQGVARHLARELAGSTGFPLAASVRGETSAAVPAITLNVAPPTPRFGEEGYQLIVTPEGVTASAASPAGLFYACQTLRQLLPPEIESPALVSGVSWTMPCLEINDRPQFPWRGCMLDSSRHFQEKAFVKRLIDLLAYHKMNRLHWHLTDDQGWRVAIAGYPNLTEIGAFRPNANARLNYLPKAQSDRYGGFHTKEDLKEIVSYAAARNVTIVPEIEMPGHCLAALLSYPELSCTGAPAQLGDRWIYDDVFCPGNEKTFEFLTGVLSELIDIFPSPWIHIGGDECPRVRWKACPKCQERMKAEGFTTEDELQGYLVRRIEEFLHAHGRRLLGWDEIAEGAVPSRAAVQSWRNTKAGLAMAGLGHDIVMSPTSHCYLDYSYDKTSVRQSYSFEPIPQGLAPERHAHILGVEGCMWLGNVSRRHLERTGEILGAPGIDYQMFPRLIALAEVGWSPEERRDWESFRTRLGMHGKRLDLLGVAYYPDPEVWSKGGD